jgi:taurine dioxygenase
VESLPSSVFASRPVGREFQRIVVAPVAGALGAEISGVDLSQPLDAGTVAELRAALLDHLVIFFRDQTLTPEQHKSLGRCFGTLSVHPYIKGLDGHPEIMIVKKEREDAFNFAGGWHSDSTYHEVPSLGSILYAIEVPPYGGDTLFASMYLAYESLSPGMKRMLDPLAALHSFRGRAGLGRDQDLGSAAAGGYAAAKGSAEAMAAPVEHPVIRTHPETGRKALYVNPMFTLRLKGFSDAESQPLLEYLYRHAERADFTCRFRWTAGAVAFWDNRSVMHLPLNDYPGERRVMHRVTISGSDRPA